VGEEGEGFGTICGLMAGGLVVQVQKRHPRRNYPEIGGGGKGGVWRACHRERIKGH